MHVRLSRGFAVIELILIIVVVGVIGVLAWVFFNNTTSPDTTSTSSDSSDSSLAYIDWSFNGNTWASASTAPSCPEPLTIKLPADAKKISNILYPGQVRGGDFKPHGGLGLEGAPNNTLAVSAALDGYLYRGARYIEGGETQYMFDFIHPCGIMYRLDHLKTLSEEFMGYANQLSEPKVDDSRTEKFSNHPLIKQGALVASEVGMSTGPNVFFDFGVYDLRKQNDASKTDTYQTDQGRMSDKEQSFYAVCWLNWLEGEEKVIVASLPARGIEGKMSDYCI